MKRNKISVNNSPIGFGDSASYEFYQIRNIGSYMMNYDRNGLEDDFMSFYFIEDENVESF